MLFGLLRKQKFHFIHAYKEEAFATVKETVKEVSVHVTYETENSGLREIELPEQYQQNFNVRNLVGFYIVVSLAICSYLIIASTWTGTDCFNL